MPKLSVFESPQLLRRPKLDAVQSNSAYGEGAVRVDRDAAFAVAVRATVGQRVAIGVGDVEVPATTPVATFGAAAVAVPLGVALAPPIATVTDIAVVPP